MVPDILFWIYSNTSIDIFYRRLEHLERNPLSKRLIFFGEFAEFPMGGSYSYDASWISCRDAKLWGIEGRS